MPITIKAIRAKRKKILTRQLKEQYRNAKKVGKRIERIKKELRKMRCV